MTREEAISLLRRYRREVPRYNLQFWSGFGTRFNYHANKSVYERFLVMELIRRINESDQDPIEVVRDFYYFMDDILCESEDLKPVAHYFESLMENMTGDILRCLREKEKDEHEQN